uniref:Uncharacterized protein n=1 Tax=Zea mays TaxID=4577 RepID=B4FHH0_MAIZE|nr:unknown [Zea mays]
MVTACPASCAPAARSSSPSAMALAVCPSAGRSSLLALQLDLAAHPPALVPHVLLPYCRACPWPPLGSRQPCARPAQSFLCPAPSPDSSAPLPDFSSSALAIMVDVHSDRASTSGYTRQPCSLCVRLVVCRREHLRSLILI